MAKQSSKSETILVVDDDPQIRTTLDSVLKSWGYKCIEAGTVADGERVFSDILPAVVLLDIDLPDGSGLDLLTRIKAINSDSIVVMITGDVNVDNTIEALRGGAHDFIGKPISLQELKITIRNGIETRELRKEVQSVRKARSEKFSFDQNIGESAPMKYAVEMARKVAESDINAVLLQGETGTGKDLFARAIHYASARADHPYLAINCAALPANLIESELFGYEKGAFTDAKSRKEGLFEQANGGTLFLDEIGEMDVTLQAKLLRVLEDNAFRRVGGLKDLPLDVRVIAASNRDLKQESGEGSFRLDLYYRLSVIQIDIPPLRDRGDDILLLAKHYIEEVNDKWRKTRKLKDLAPEAASLFLKHEWLGNVRELKNVIERASILEDGEHVTARHLPFNSRPGASAAADGSPSFILPPSGIPLADVEMQLVHQALERTGGNLTQAAKLLDISRDQLRYRLKKEEEGG
ncbi:MAG: sigma-54-dependent Fis family transcriptional regulator [Aridibacter famidurans]|nr:sigma-54-dependent Fis family transcriptional regulator [Aridibacter famidurans]